MRNRRTTTAANMAVPHPLTITVTREAVRAYWELVDAKVAHADDPWSSTGFTAEEAKQILETAGVSVGQFNEHVARTCSRD